MTSAKPSLELLRELSDEHVLGSLIEVERQTRAELATRTGISKPTVAESVRRLEAFGVVVDSGERTVGPGRVGTYYSLAPDVGIAVAVSIAPQGIVAEAVNIYGTVIARESAAVSRPARPRDVARPLREVCQAVAARAGVAVRLAVVSAADPVDRATGRLVHLPDAPFLVGELSPAEILAGLTSRVYVDNDVNWAARAERVASVSGSLQDAVYLYLGEGLGGAVISDGEVRRGHCGLGGEVMHVLTVGPGGRACTFTEVFAKAGLQRDDSPAVDLEKIDRVLSGPTAGQRSTRDVVARAIAGICSAVVGLVDPEVIVLGGPWGVHPALVGAVTAEVTLLPRPVTVRPASVIDEAPLIGARADAVSRLRVLVLQYRNSL